MDARDYEDAYQRDDKPREVKSNRAWRLECESLRQQLAECEREREILKRKAELPMRYKRMEHNASLQRELATVTKERDELVEAVLAVCCDPEGRVVICGSDGDRAVLQAALAKLGADKGEK